MRALDLTLTASFRTEEDYERFVDDLMALGAEFSIALSGPAWDSPLVRIDED